jgi:hypothetical protein
VIRKYYGLSMGALLAIPVTAVLGVRLFLLIDPELARGRPNYVLYFALLDHVRRGVWLLTLLAVCVLWLLCCAWLLRARGRPLGWLWLALLGPFGFAGMFALTDRTAPASGATSGTGARGRLAYYARKLWRVLFEVLRFTVLWFVALQLVQWFDDATAWLEACRRGVPLAQVLAERDASSGMWAFGDSLTAGFLLALCYMLCYLLWPIRRRAAAADPTAAD